jgi:hypothetical protein
MVETRTVVIKKEELDFIQVAAANSVTALARGTVKARRLFAKQIETFVAKYMLSMQYY